MLVEKEFHIYSMSRIHHIETFLLIALVLHVDNLFLYLIALASFTSTMALADAFYPTRSGCFI